MTSLPKQKISVEIVIRTFKTDGHESNFNMPVF